MIQTDQPKFNPDAVAALKAATRQVVQPAAPNIVNFGSPTASLVVKTDPGESKQTLQPSHPHKNFAEAFVGKITSVEQATAKIEQERLVVEQELDRVEQLQSDLIAKKKQLENRSQELITVKDKLTALDKELSEALKLPAL